MSLLLLKIFDFAEEGTVEDKIDSLQQLHATQLEEWGNRERKKKRNVDNSDFHQIIVLEEIKQFDLKLQYCIVRFMRATLCKKRSCF